MSKEINFRTTEYGIIEHESGEYEVIEHIEMCESKEEARELIDELEE